MRCPLVYVFTGIGRLVLHQETHLIHKFMEDFYGHMLSVVMVGYIRAERGFSSLGKTYSPVMILVSIQIHTDTHAEMVTH